MILVVHRVKAYLSNSVYYEINKIINANFKIGDLSLKLEYLVVIQRICNYKIMFQLSKSNNN